MDFMSDYNFLEECTRYVGNRKGDKIKKFTKYNGELPTNKFKLRAAARTRNTRLCYLLPNFTKSQKNTSRLDYQTQTISWKIEWTFPNAGEKVLIFSDDHCNENQKLVDLCQKYIDSTCLENVPGKKELEFYHSKTVEDLKFLLKAEGVRRSSQRFYNLNPWLSLKENFNDKTIVEYPVIYVVFANFTHELDIIDSDDDLEEEKQQYEKLINDTTRLPTSNVVPKQEQDVKRTDTKMKEAAEMPKSFFFMDERDIDALSDDEIK